MPELPEVETIRRQLAAALIGKTFETVDRMEPAMLRDSSPENLRVLLPERRIEQVNRLGKFLIVALDCDIFLTLHLGMTGQLLINGGAAGPHTRFVFRLREKNDSGREDRPNTRLEFRDVRKFGRLHLTCGVPAPRLAGLGPDAWSGRWDAAYLAEELRGRTASLKAFLLDQRHLAGIGNIYADEILWWTRLSPLRRCGSVSGEEVARLADEIPRRLGEGVRSLGCSLSDFVDTQGEPGGFQLRLQAYGRQGRTCRRCSEKLVRTTVAGRGTVYCPHCQR